MDLLDTKQMDVNKRISYIELVIDKQRILDLPSFDSFWSAPENMLDVQVEFQ
jgi:hypothetical protein